MLDLSNSSQIYYNYFDWITHFEKNAKARLNIDFSFENELTTSERNLIFPSISAFQKGERSDGKHLMLSAQIFSNKINKPEYLSVIRLFIKEENWHSAYLEKFMNFHKEPLKDSVFIDTIFRKIRRLYKIEAEIFTLLTAEIVAMSYYDALEKSTTSYALKSICKQILQDEPSHIILQAYTISHFEKRHLFLRKILMFLTTSVVWLSYKKMFVKGGYSFTSFLKSNMHYLDEVEKIVLKIK